METEQESPGIAARFEAWARRHPVGGVWMFVTSQLVSLFLLIALAVATRGRLPGQLHPALWIGVAIVLITWWAVGRLARDDSPGRLVTTIVLACVVTSWFTAKVDDGAESRRELDRQTRETRFEAPPPLEPHTPQIERVAP